MVLLLPRLQKSKFGNVPMSKFLSALDLLGYRISSESVKSVRYVAVLDTLVRVFKWWNVFGGGEGL